MRYLLLSLLLACTGFLSAQCFIEAEIENIECDSLTGEAVVTFFINGEGSSWFSPTLDLEGPYDSNASFTTPPIDLSLTGGIQFVDQQNDNCQFFLAIDSLICETTCSNLLVFVEEEGANPCGSMEDQLFYVWVESAAAFPVTVEIIDPTSTIITEVYEQPQGTPFDVPVGEAFVVRVTDAEGCVFEEAVINDPVECGAITGRSWLDANGNGLQDPGESAPVGATLSLFRGSINGQAMATTSTAADGTYSFSGLEPFTWYSVSILSFQDELELTFFNEGNDPTVDNDFNPTNNATGSSFVNPGATVTLDAGWRSDPCTLLDVGLTPIEPSNPCDILIYELDVISDAYPVEVSIFTGSPTDTILEFTLTEDGSLTIDQLTPGGYGVWVTNAAGCVRGFDMSIPDPEGIVVEIAQDGDLCQGDLTLTAIPFDTDGSPLVYVWSSGEETQTITPSTFGFYSVTVTSEEGCPAEGQIFVNQSNFDTIDVPEVVILNCDGSPTTITIANPIEGFTYTWFGPQNDIQTGTSITVSNSGWYEIQGTNESEDCSTFGFTQITDLNLSNVTLQGFNQDSICGIENCIFLTGLGQQFSLDNIEIDWDGPPSFNEWADSLDFPIQQFCGVPEGTYTVTVSTVCDTIVLTYDNNNLACSEISGTLYLDTDGDCDLDADDLPAPGFIVTITNEATGEMYYAWTGSNGNWSIELPNGVYTIEPIIEPGQPLTTCPATTVALNGNAVTGVQIFMPVLESCPVLTTEVTIPFLRRCFTGCAYVNYENTGTATGEDAQVVVVLDPFFIDVIPSVEPVSVVGNVYTFNLGDLPPFSNGSIGFIFTVSCEAELGQSHCIDASITPDDPCGTDPLWNGALVDITNVVCDGDSVRFTVTNIGETQMSVPLSYVIVEDGIMLSADPFVNGLLQPNEEYFVAVATPDGATIGLITNQEPNAPGSEEPSLVFEGCNGNGEGFSTGFTNLLPLTSGNPSRSIVCRENVGSYDPNDKMGYPLGWGDANIEKGTRLDYEIRFQNTGTDTAFTVVISDTLAETLDLATFKMEATSHPVSVEIDTHRVITWTFNNILLPDSTTNLLLSQGSVIFSIDHAASLEGGDEILNEAAIYFDFNEPVITNVSRHVIAKDGLPTGVRSVAAQSVNISVFPNPVADLLRVNVPAQEAGQTDLVTVTDLYGRPLLTKPYRQIGQGLNVSSLPAGYYLLLLTDESGRARGRVPFVVATR